MEIKVDQLIEKIKKEGVDKARCQAEEIVKEANHRASGVLDEANRSAEEIVNRAKDEAERIKKTAEQALTQSARDLSLVVKERMVGLFDSVFKKEIKAELKDGFLADIIVRIVEQWANGKDVEVFLSDEQADKVKSLVVGKVRASIKDTVTVNVDERVSAGFRIGFKDGDLVYDFTEQGIFEMLKVFVSPKIAAILNENG